jgi:hypothetical protein
MPARDERIQQLLEQIGHLGAELVRPGARPVPELKAELERARHEIGLLLEGVPPAKAAAAAAGASAGGEKGGAAASLADRVSSFVDQRLKKRAS